MRTSTNNWYCICRNPNGPDLAEWPSFNDKDHQYMVLNAHPAQTNYMRGSKMRFWRDEASKYLKKKIWIDRILAAK